MICCSFIGYILIWKNKTVFTETFNEMFWQLHVLTNLTNMKNIMPTMDKKYASFFKKPSSNPLYLMYHACIPPAREDHCSVPCYFAMVIVQDLSFCTYNIVVALYCTAFLVS